MNKRSSRHNYTFQGKIELKEAELRAFASALSEKETEMQSKIEEYERKMEEQKQRLASKRGSQLQEQLGNGTHRYLFHQFYVFFYPPMLRRLETNTNY